jgi:hypothetical protein
MPSNSEFTLGQEDAERMFNSSVLDVAAGLIFVYLLPEPRK